MKTLVVVRDILDAEKHLGYPPTVIHPENLLDVYSENQGGSVDLVFFVQAEVKLPLLYKFVEDYEGSLTVYLSDAKDLVFVSRFSQVTVFQSYSQSYSQSYTRSELVKPYSWADQVKDLKKVLRVPVK